MKKIHKLIIFILCVGMLSLGESSVYAVEESQSPLPEQMPQTVVPELPPQEPVVLQQQGLPTESTLPPAQEENVNTEDIQEYESLNLMMIANSEANVRSGPDTRYKSLGRLEKGQQVYVLGRVPGNWYQVVYGEGSAFVFCDYLTEIEVEEIESEAIVEELDTASRMAETDSKIEQLQKELDSVKKTANQAKKNAKEAIALVSEEEPEGEERAKKIALILALLLAVGFIRNVIVALKPINVKETRFKFKEKNTYNSENEKI